MNRLDTEISTIFDNKIVWLNTKEAAHYLRISADNLRVKVSRGEISIDGKLGKCWRFKKENLDRLLESSLNLGGFRD